MTVIESWTDYGRGYEDGVEKTIDRVLEAIDKVSHKAIARGEFWTAEKTIKILRRDVEALKGGEKND